MKKCIAVLLAALMLLSIVGCATTDDKPGTTTSGSETTSPDETTEPVDNFYAARNEAKDNLPDTLNYADADVRILCRNIKENPSSGVEFFSEEDSTDGVKAAIVKRNANVEERLKIKIVPIEASKEQGVSDLLQISVMSFSEDYEIATLGGGMGIAASGYLTDLMTLDYLDFDQPWWNQRFCTEIAIDGRLFCCTGELAVSLLSHNMVTFFNKTVWNDFYPNEDLYQLVRDGNWTLDAVIRYCNGVYRDLNSDGIADVDDLYGNVHPYETTNTSGWSAGSCVTYATYDEDSERFIYTANNDHNAAYVEKMKTLLYRDNNTYVSENNEMDRDDQLMKKIKNDTALFTLAKMYDFEYLRDMDSDFGIVPPAKFDEAQDAYHSTAENGYTKFGVVVNAADPDMAAAFLEAACAENYRYVTPEYYDSAVKYKYSRDEESAEMLDICTAGITFEFAQLAGDYGGEVFSTMFCSEQNMDRMSSFLTKKGKVYEQNLNDLLDDLRAIA